MSTTSPTCPILGQWRSRADAALEIRLPPAHAVPEKLHTAMRYAVLGGGKRVRPALCYTTGKVLGIPPDWLDDAACAVEFIHAYSLVHDDLPAMDDDDLRRGRPTTHRAFDEATAILAGDALQCLAFELLSRPLTTDGPTAAQQLRQIRTLSRACGSLGMAGGQAMDLAVSAGQIDERHLETIHRQKTGALICAAVRLAADLALPADAPAYAGLDRCAAALGLAFQIQDDILDLTADTATLGKRQGADLAHDKATYPQLMGLAAAQQRAAQLHQQALGELAPFGAAADPLRALADELLNRHC
jgi:geranylgeranyl pyrophosphate synthase